MTATLPYISFRGGSGRLLALEINWPEVGTYTVDVRLAAAVAIVVAYFSIGFLARLMNWFVDKIAGTEEEEEEVAPSTVPSSPARTVQNKSFPPAAFMSSLESRLKSIESQISRIFERLESVETRNASAASSSSAAMNTPPAQPTVPLPPMGAPPPPPPPPPIMPPAPALQIKKRDGTVQKEKADDQPSMAQVLRELSLVQRKVTSMISSPRSQYLRHRTTHVAVPSLRRTAFTANEDDDGHPNRDNNEQKPRNLSGGIVSASDDDNGLEDDSDNELSSPLRKKSSRVNSPVPTLPSSASEQGERAFGGLVGAGRHSADRTAEDERVNVMHKSMDGSARQAILRSKLDHSIATASALPKPELFSEMSTLKLRKTNIPRSPGGTTLIPLRKPSRSTEDLVSTLKAKFARAYPQNSPTDNDRKDDEEESPFE
ncbi:hypothetical protein HDV00_001570 [Rhizophlyctis rosea]|nr:hypothetical protein HDV00_001570 [Rhizophlyctis rosea]